MTDFTNRVALVTGSAQRRQGYTLRYASLGAKVALNYADDETDAVLALAEVRNYGVDAVAIQADVSKVDNQALDVWAGQL